MTKLETKIRKELVALKAKPEAQHHIPEYQQTGFAEGRLMEARARQKYAQHWRERVLDAIAGADTATEHKVRVKYGRFYPSKTFHIYRVNGKDVLLVNKRASSHSAFKTVDLTEMGSVLDYFLDGQARVIEDGTTCVPPLSFYLG